MKRLLCKICLLLLVSLNGCKGLLDLTLDTMEAVVPPIPSAYETYCSKVYLGMTTTEAVSKFGYPWDINSSTGSWGIHEQWVYRNMMAEPGDVCYLYFENNILTSWQD